MESAWAGGWRGAYTFESGFHEPFVLFGFMAAVTTVVEFCPGVLILPQRQTALVAKQAVEVDVLSAEPPPARTSPPGD